MIDTITLDTRKDYVGGGNAHISPLRRGERNNVQLTVVVRRDSKPYDLTGMTAHLVWKAADGKLVGPVPMEVTDQAEGIVRCTLPAACYSAVGMARAYVELRGGAELVDTTDEMSIKVLDCIDADGEQAEEYKPLIAEVREAADAAVKAAARAESGEDERVKAETSRVSAETARDQAETERTNGWANLKADAQDAIAEVKATEAKLYPAAENVLKGTAKGTFVHVDDAFSGAALRGITVEGACKQDGIPSPDAPKPIAVVENPAVKVAGRNLLEFAFPASEASYSLDVACIPGYSLKNISLPYTTRSSSLGFGFVQELMPGSYTVKAYNAPQKATVNVAGYASYEGISSPKKSIWHERGKNLDAAATFMVDGEQPQWVVFCFAAEWGDGTNKVTYPADFKAVVEYGGTATEYVPYTSQTLTFTLPSEHPYLAKLPDGTADEITVDRDGNVELVARVGKSTAAVSDGVGGDIGTDALSSTGAIADGAVVYYKLATPVTYQLGEVTVPRLPESTSNVWTDAEVTPRTGIEYTRDVNIVVANIESAIASITEG